MQCWIDINEWQDGITVSCWVFVFVIIITDKQSSLTFCVVKELHWNLLCLSPVLWVVKLVRANNNDDACKDADNTIHWLPAVNENDDKARLPWLFGFRVQLLSLHCYHLLQHKNSMFSTTSWINLHVCSFSFHVKKCALNWPHAAVVGLPDSFVCQLFFIQGPWH